jgi:membrane-associated phospholipid phosphatase
MGWRAIATGAILAQLVAVLPIAAVAGWRYELPLISYWKAALGVSIIGSGLYALLVVLRSLARNEARPGRAVLVSVLRLDLPLVALLVGTQLALLGWLKATMPYAVGFWADPFLADLDWKLFGVDPWVPLHTFPMQAVDRIYLTWGPFCASVAIALSFAPNDRRKGQCLVAYFLTVASCALGQYLLPSAGPVFYEEVGYGKRFADLPILPWVRSTADFLWGAHLSPGFRVGSGISAFPSLHVAGAFWMALVARAYVPRLQLIGWAYWLTILIGSVYLGWHYAVDGIAGTGLAFVIFRLAGRLTLAASATPIEEVKTLAENRSSI